jgi:hypothetical protein
VANSCHQNRRAISPITIPVPRDSSRGSETKSPWFEPPWFGLQLPGLKLPPQAPVWDVLPLLVVCCFSSRNISGYFLGHHFLPALSLLQCFSYALLTGSTLSAQCSLISIVPCIRPTLFVYQYISSCNMSWTRARLQGFPARTILTVNWLSLPFLESIKHRTYSNQSYFTVCTRSCQPTYLPFWHLNQERYGYRLSSHCQSYYSLGTVCKKDWPPSWLPPVRGPTMTWVMLWFWTITNLQEELLPDI